MEELYTLELIEKGKRVDKRRFDEFRKVEIKEGIIKKAEGSASVRIGETEVTAGVKLDFGKPFPDSPEEGMLIVNAEFTPLASPDFESGPPGEDAVELARIVDRGIRESNCIELEKLCIAPAEKVWSVFVDIHIINHQGNLLDASALASLVALLNTKIPKLEDDKILRGEFERNLPVVFKPINITVCKAGNSLLVDPSFEEEKILGAKLSVCVRDDDRVCALQKQGNKELSLEDIEKMIDVAIEKSKEIRSLIR
ncbi:MAG: exosome complex protein Rrp42 [Candidatus Aenigmarchaeota archaeon]|nr:exosome complex protein Rrp42 [Candidatus Aenigmarchaeota archaeon]